MNDARLGLHRGKLAVGAVERRSLLRQPIDVRRLREGIAIAAEPVVEIVGDDEEDVLFLRDVLGVRGCWERAHQGNDEDASDCVSLESLRRTTLRP